MRHLLKLPELARLYGATTINVAYEPKHADAKPMNIAPNGIAYYTLPMSLDVIIRNKVWLAYDDEKDTIVRPTTIIGVGNHWLNTLTDDHRNKRIDITNYLIGQ